MNRRTILAAITAAPGLALLVNQKTFTASLNIKKLVLPGFLSSGIPWFPSDLKAHVVMGETKHPVKTHRTSEGHDVELPLGAPIDLEWTYTLPLSEGGIKLSKTWHYDMEGTFKGFRAG